VQRYIIPLIKPPTPPQLEQDKATIDESFERAFALLDQLNTDTTALKAAEESRTTRLDSALADLESVLGSLKEADRKREDDSRRNADEIRSLRDLIPKAIEAQKEANDTRLKELGTELKSLRTLVGNRMGGTAPPPTNGLGHRSTGSSGTGIGYTPSSTTQAVQPVQTSASIEAPALNSPTTSLNSASATSTEIVGGAPATAPVPATASSSSRFGSGRAAIPAWQMAAAKKSQEALNGEKKDTSSSGTAVEASST
jgi:peroxin-14